MGDISNLWIKFNAEIRRYIVRRIGDKAEVDDIVQDVFLKIIKNRQKIQTVENVQEYLYKMTRNTIADNFRVKKIKLVELKGVERTEEEADENLNTLISECCIKFFIDKLPEKYKEALTYTELEKLSQKEFAEKANISYSGAKSRVQRGREKLKDLLNECCQFESDKYGNLLDSEAPNCGC